MSEKVRTGYLAGNMDIGSYDTATITIEGNIKVVAKIQELIDQDAEKHGLFVSAKHFKGK